MTSHCGGHGQVRVSDLWRLEQGSKASALGCGAAAGSRGGTEGGAWEAGGGAMSREGRGFEQGGPP